MEGIKETKEMMVGCLAIAVVFAKLAKDGVQLTDAVQLMAELQKPEMQEKLKSAMDQKEKIPAEMKDLNFAEGLELIGAMLPGLEELYKAVAKPA